MGRVPQRWKEEVDEAKLLGRALAAWFRAGGTDLPSEHSGVVRHNKLRYVVLKSGRGAGAVLAVYRVRNQGMLRRLKRWPVGLV